MKPTRWQSQRERSAPWAVNLLAFIVRHLGRGAGRALLWPIAGYFVCFGPVARRASRDYLRRLDGSPSWLTVVRHFHCFAACTLDRLLLLRHGGISRLQICSRVEPEAKALIQGGGCILITAHIGSFESLRALDQTRARPKLRVVLDRGQGAMVTQLFERLDPTLIDRTIDADRPDFDLALAIRDALDRGENIGLMGDRLREGTAAQPVQLLGAAALLPTGPWLLAAALKVPVLLAFGLYRGGRQYDIYCERFDMQLDLPRGDRQRALVPLMQRYADRLEHHLRLAPLNWFNFYPFWSEQASE